jgi:TatD DNase family protein
MELIDSHCHPYFPKLIDQLDQVLDRAEQAGVKRIIAVGTTLADSQQASELAGKYDNIWASAGVHPHDAAAFLADKAGIDNLKTILNKSRIVAVGEIGLDYYKNYSARDDQVNALRTQIEATLELNLPYIFHVRDGWEDFWTVFDSYPGLRGVVHSFTADESELNNVLSRDLFVSLNGIMTFSKDESQLESAKNVPLDRLLLETDAPFLTPAPYRGEVCEPRHVAVVAEFLAKLRGEDLTALASATTENAVKLFGLRNV